MFIVDTKKVVDITAGDGTYIKELMSPVRDNVKAGYSLALSGKNSVLLLAGDGVEFCTAE